MLVSVGWRPVTDNLNRARASVNDKGFMRRCSAQDRGRRHLCNRRHHRRPDVARNGKGVVAAEAIGGDRSSAFDPVAIPNCIYTDPEVATVGLSEEDAKAAGYEVRIGKFPLMASGRARTMNETDGLIKLVGDAKTDALLGMHIVAPQAESLIGEGVIALEMGATIEDIGLSIHPHPTLTEGILDAAEAMHVKAIHPQPNPPRRRRHLAQRIGNTHQG